MSTFYLLPPRPQLGLQFVRFLEGYFPDLHWNAAQRAELAEALGATACSQPGVVVIFREDLPEGGELKQVLGADFGAAAGDEVVEVAANALQRWSIAG